jgi:hypothetical protein
MTQSGLEVAGRHSLAWWHAFELAQADPVAGMRSVEDATLCAEGCRDAAASFYSTGDQATHDAVIRAAEKYEARANGSLWGAMA